MLLKKQGNRFWIGFKLCLSWVFLLKVKESQGQYMEAINLYMKAGLPARAARLALSIDVSNDVITIDLYTLYICSWPFICFLQWICICHHNLVLSTRSSLELSETLPNPILWYLCIIYILWFFILQLDNQEMCLSVKSL